MSSGGEIETFAAMIDRAQRVLFITGAGLSADSGLPTYRGVGGMYEVAPTEEGLAIEDALSGPMMAARPELTWKYIHEIEQASRGAVPNPGHDIIARLEARVGELWVLTQNVDGFHGRAGSSKVIEIHGNIHDLDCTRCRWSEHVRDYSHLPPLPRCPECDAVVRPRVILFGEMLPSAASAEYERQTAEGFDLVVSVGTTSALPYIAAPVMHARMSGVDTVEINPGQTEVSGLVRLRIAARARPTLEALWNAVG